jgi:hypothetical protein
MGLCVMQRRRHKDNILVDARTGLEVRNIHFAVANRAEILLKVAQKLESDLLVEQVSY